MMKTAVARMIALLLVATAFLGFTDLTGVNPEPAQVGFIIVLIVYVAYLARDIIDDQ